MTVCCDQCSSLISRYFQVSWVIQCPSNWMTSKFWMPLPVSLPKIKKKLETKIEIMAVWSQDWDWLNELRFWDLGLDITTVYNYVPSISQSHSLSLASVKSRLILLFWYRLTRVVPDKGPLNGCVYLPISVPYSEQYGCEVSRLRPWHYGLKSET